MGRQTNKQIIIICNVTCAMFGEIPGGRIEQRMGILGCILGKLSKGRDLTSHHSAFLRPEGKLRKEGRKEEGGREMGRREG